MLDQKDLELLAGMINPINVQLGNINNRLDGIDARLDAVDTRLDGIDARLDAMDVRLDGIDARLDVKLAERDIRKDIKNLQDTTETLVVVLQGRGILPDPGNTIQTA